MFLVKTLFRLEYDIPFLIVLYYFYFWLEAPFMIFVFLFLMECFFHFSAHLDALQD